MSVFFVMPVQALSEEETLEVERILDEVLTPSIYILLNPDAETSTPEALKSKDNLKFKLTNELRDLESGTTSKIENREYDLRTILQHYEVYANFYYKMQKYGFDVFSADQLLDMLKLRELHYYQISQGIYYKDVDAKGSSGGNYFRNDPELDRMKITAFVEHHVKSRKFSYRLFLKIKSRVNLKNICSGLFTKK
ncbi:MAG TPA: hypothetical protein PLJ21_00455 [Pseudobdellovibrionaceae bacterium]|nr:hypothetical protein [Pseudobdellovibrionaceae bacterium]